MTLEGRMLTLEDVLIFFTAADREPGQHIFKFEHSPTHDQKYAHAST